jgi:hypothetical protein
MLQQWSCHERGRKQIISELEFPSSMHSAVKLSFSRQVPGQYTSTLVFAMEINIIV